MYKKLEDTQTAYFDVDDTLVLWRQNPSEDIMNQVIIIQDRHFRIAVTPHLKHIEALKWHKSHNHVVVVWSQGGSDWAESVVKALKLEEYVDVILTKPTSYYDDLDVTMWMPTRVYKDQE